MAGWLELDAVATTSRGALAEALGQAGVPVVEPDLSS
jgi:hypothetical protein